MLSVTTTTKGGYPEGTTRSILLPVPPKKSGYVVYRGILHSTVYDTESSNLVLAVFDGVAEEHGKVPQKIYDMLKVNRAHNGKGVRISC